MECHYTKYRVWINNGFSLLPIMLPIHRIGNIQILTNSNISYSQMLAIKYQQGSDGANIFSK